MCSVVLYYSYIVRERDGGGRGGVHAARRGREQQLPLLAVGERRVRHVVHLVCVVSCYTIVTLCASAMEAGAEECMRRGAGASSSCRFSLSESGECAT
ncbi:unnamed protein product [Euphydryas editha]|uniref:Uncharacterized protein n=1 Tax=Euphydryas editha TaxID=104508 RepID=A0AAU9U3A7_EUPED|nr:unnamed protein product [Euphydryas editha]CAH2093547.1 unnamed protein product [Euphydryas editha]CAH2093549.1 unnamed protein product [Euphydryas editha]CAH2093550.1 unnamed protein product [Euphydryas editha]CAH2093551.1 unnamed protein product [Euphydryas editha]